MDSTSSQHPFEETKWTKSEQARDHSFSLLTVIYALVITVFSLSLEIWLQGRDELDNLRLIFNAFMLCGGLTVMFYFYAFILYPQWFYRAVEWLKNKDVSEAIHTRRAKHLNSGAGSFYLRIGALAFGAVAVFYCGLKIYVHIYKHSSDGGKHKTSDVCNNALQLLYFFIQMHFIFRNSQMRVSRSCRLVKLGVMHLVAVNLWTWFHEFLEKQKSTSANGKVFADSPTQYNGTNASTSPNVMYAVYTNAKFLMSTCVVEYSLIGAAVMLVLWMNIGRPDEDHSTPVNHHQMRADCSASSTGIFAGIVYLLIAVVDMGIFDPKAYPTRSYVSWSIDITLLAVALFACVVGMWLMRRLSYSEGHHSSAETLDEILLVIGLIGEVVFCSIMLLEFFPTMPCKSVSCTTEQQLILFSLNAVRLVQVLVQALLILFSTKLVAAGERVQDKPGKQFITFLLIANVVLFILHSYKAQRRAIDGEPLYSSSQSVAILNVVNPLVIFFRFHSSVCLADLWKRAYPAKDSPSHAGVRSYSSRRSSDRESASSVRF